jgi:S1-C subfamily serine protease
MSSEWNAISTALADATEKAAAFAVAVHAEPRGSSSGVIWRPGLVVTAEHALRRDEEIHVTLPDDKVVPAKLLGRDPATDMAVLKVDEAAAVPPTFGDTNELRPGQLTLVVGRTRASGPVANFGVVSLVAKERRLWGGSSLSPYVRLDVAMQRISVGGAVVNASGQIAGIATPKFASAGALATPVSTVHHVIDVLLSKGHIPRGYLGVGLQSIRLPESLRESLQRREKGAVIVLDVQPGAPADAAGVVIGDILIAIDGKPVMRLEDVHAHLHEQHIGKTVAADFLRGGERRSVNIEIKERPNEEHAR